MPLRGNDDDPIAGQSRAGQALQPGADLRRQRGRVARVEAKLHRAGNFVDILPARSRGANEGFGDLAFVEGNVGGDRNHCQFLERAHKASELRIRDTSAD